MLRRRLPVIDLDKLRTRANTLSSEFDSRRWHGRSNWLIVQIMMDHDFMQKEISEFLDLNHSTINYYESKCKPWPGEIDLLEKLRKEFPPISRKSPATLSTLDVRPSGIQVRALESDRST